MNRWHQIHRMRGAAFLILIGVLALLNQWHILRWGQSWPLFLIVAGLLALAERAAWTADVREQQAAQGLGLMGQAGGQPAPPNPTGPSYWSAASPANAGEAPFIQTQPPAPEDPGREER
jgi:hypothetical protein